MKHFLTLFLVILVFSCEPQTVDIDLPYKKEIVVYGQIIAGEPVRNIQITKTLPPLSVEEGYGEVDPRLFKLSDAEVTITDGGNTWTLTQTTNPIYYENLDLIPEQGKTYTLKISWDGINVEATTFIPRPIIVDGLILKKLERENILNGYVQYFDLTVTLSLEKNNYFATSMLGYDYIWNEQNSLTDSVEVFNFWEGFKFVENDQKFETKIGNSSIHIDTVFNESYLYVNEYIVQNSDPVLRKYINSDKYNNESDSFLGGSATRLEGNVEGDGFGVFYGSSLTRIHITKEDLIGKL